jgi:hypothetical protein
MRRQKSATGMGDVETVCANISVKMGNIRVIKYAHRILHKNCDFLEYSKYYSF